MDIKINKGISITISLIWIIVSMFSLFIVYGFLYFTHGLNLNEIKWGTLILLNFGFIIESLISLVIGIWLYLNVNNYHQDKWTWMIMGFIYGQFSLILLMLIVFVQNINSKIDLVKALRNLFILLVLSFLLNLVSKYLINPNISKIMDIEYGFYISSYIQILDSIPGIMILLLNVILAIKFAKSTNAFNLENKTLWILAILTSGLLPLILYNGFTILEREKINAA